MTTREGSIVQIRTNPEWSLIGTDIRLNAKNGISGTGTKIQTNGLVKLETENGNIQFAAIKRERFSVSGSTEAGARGIFGSIKTEHIITKTTDYDYASISGGAGVHISSAHGGIDLEGTNIHSEEGDVSLNAKTISLTSLTAHTDIIRKTQDTGLFATFTEEETTSADYTQMATISGRNVTLLSQDSLSLHAYGIKAKDDITLYSEGDIKLTAAVDRVVSNKVTHESGLTIGTDLGDGKYFGALGEAAPGWISLFGGTG